MTRSIERLGSFLAQSRRYLLEGAMPARRLPRRASVDDCADDGWDVALTLVPIPSASAASAGHARAPARPRVAQSNENRPSATSFARG